MLKQTRKFDLLKILMSMSCFLIIMEFSLSAAPLQDADLEDVFTEDMETGSDKNTSAEKKELSSVEMEGSTKNKLSYRLYSIGNFSYQPVGDTKHLAVVNGLFQEKSATAEMNLEVILNSDLPQKANSVIKSDIQAKVSSLYTADSYFFVKGSGDWLKINEAFYEVTTGFGMSFLLGKYRRIFSPGIFQNPMDRHNPKSSLPGEPAQREGAWLAQTSLDGDFHTSLLSRWRITAAYLPFYFNDKYGMPVTTRDKYVLNKRSPMGVVKTTESNSGEYQGGFVRLYLDVFKGDFNAVYYYLEKQHQEGVSYSKYFLDRLEWHGEILFYEKPRSDFAITPTDLGLYVDALSGFRIDIGDSSTIGIEYLYRQENPQNYPEDSLDQRKLWLGQLTPDSNGQASTPMRHYIVFSMMSMNIKDTLDIAFNVITNPFDQEYLYSLRTDYKVDKSAKISLAGLLKSGSSTNTFYGNFFPFDYQIRMEFFIALL